MLILRTKIGFRDKLDRDIREGHKIMTTDRKGKIWYGTIVKIDDPDPITSILVQEGKFQYAFKSNYETWINDQEYASRLLIISEPEPDEEGYEEPSLFSSSVSVSSSLENKSISSYLSIWENIKKFFKCLFK